MPDIGRVEFPGRPPTYEEAKENTVVGGCMAAWFPQMGGHCGMCWVMMGCYNALPPTDTPGMDVQVWHDGDFPINSADDDGNYPRTPMEFHFCDAEHFIEFGKKAIAFLDTFKEST